jgi:hypothetical protein
LPLTPWRVLGALSHSEGGEESPSSR